MENNRAKELMVTVLQKALTGQLKSDNTVNPQNIADAIVQVAVFDKSYVEVKNDKIVGKFNEKLVEYRSEMRNALLDLSEDEELLRNFILGKLTAYEELLEELKNIK